MKMESTIRLINLNEIIPNRFQPRLVFDNDALNELADSIRIHGIIEPLVLRRVQDKYEIIAGERRFKAASLVGLTAVPAIIVDVNDNESAEVAIIENTQRKNLNPIEEATSYKKLLERKYLTQDQLAKRLGTSQSNIANKIRLLNLDQNVQTALLKDQISERHARSLLHVTDKMKQVELLNKVITERIPVRALDEMVDEIVQSYNKSYDKLDLNTNTALDVNIDDIINNSEDILTDEKEIKYHYNPNQYASTDVKKESHFFNNLENENVNMDPTLAFGFNPFKKQDINHDMKIEEKDYDILEEKLEEDEDYDELPIEDETPKIIEYDTKESVTEGIKEIISSAQKNGINIKIEEFNFDNIKQFIIRIDK